MRRTRLLALLPLCAAALPGPGHTAAAEPVLCFGRPATIVGGAGNNFIRGSDGRDVIVAGAGNDRVAGMRGNDRICGGPGRDILRGSAGIDRIAGGAGRDAIAGGTGTDVLRAGGGSGERVLGQRGTDWISGGPGSERLIGGRGNDSIRGGRGGDTIEGGLGDDRLFGGGGGDAISGDLGNDRLLGGRGGADVLRGDFGRDLIDGGRGGSDIASFSGADEDGVVVDLAGGRASGDGEDRLRRIENVVGSSFADRIRGGSGPNLIDGAAGDDRLFGGPPGDSGPDTAFGGAGTDRCAAFEVEDSCEGGAAHPPRTGTSVALTRGLAGDNLVVRGTRGPNSVRLIRRGTALLVLDASGIDPAAGSGCAHPSPQVARCPLLRSLDFALIATGAGDDQVIVGQSVSQGIRVRVAGGAGRDRLVGGRGADVLDGGHGNDRLFGRGGADAVVSTRGADVLSGGSDADLLVSSGACNGDRMRGGDGVDSGSFARVVAGVVRARIGGHAVNLARIRDGGPCRRVRIQRTVEGLEGSPGRDILIGNRGRNNLLGRDGADVLHGRGGGDRLVGGGGRDSLRGGAGSDRLYARDGMRDRGLDCGPGYAQLVSRDRRDPPATGC